MTPLAPSELWTLLLCTVRYAMGRRTYIVGETCDLVRALRADLEPWQVAQIAREVREELERCEARGQTLGADMDHREWRRLVDELTA